MESQQEEINQASNEIIITTDPDLVKQLSHKKRGRPLGKKDTKKRAPYKKRNNDNTTI